MTRLKAMMPLLLLALLPEWSNPVLGASQVKPWGAS